MSPPMTNSPSPNEDQARDHLGDAPSRAEQSDAAAKHTPGPWEWDCGIIPPDGPGRYADIYKDGGDLIIATFNDQIAEGHANARLIAAAPDLLEALKLADAMLSGANMNAGVVERKVKASIAKAEGQS